MEWIKMYDGKDQTEVIYSGDNNINYPLSICQESGDIKLFQSVFLTKEEAIELINFLNEVLPK